MIRILRRNLRNRRFRVYGESLGLYAGDVANLIDCGYSAWVESYGAEINIIIYGTDGISRIMVLPAWNIHRASLWAVEFNRRAGRETEKREA